ncbi:type I toxin-antitoxin system Fst family toxin, partial [Staphylococcus haemolyticus]
VALFTHWLRKRNDK